MGWGLGSMLNNLFWTTSARIWALVVCVDARDDTAMVPAAGSMSGQRTDNKIDCLGNNQFTQGVPRLT